ncbi:MAG TPA: hypothetical protein VLH19_02085 [Patescibacteria group bacterium]|nr:hypothetical protein [Patescibacteria group bacterium]
MSTKTIVWITVFLGSTIGSYIPVLLGSSFLSIASVLGSGVGGFLGIIVGIKIGNMVND